jgi:hypothetical protein
MLCAAVQVATIRNSHPMMGGKAFTCAVVLPRDEHGEAAAVPRLAIGSADGSVRVLNGFKPETLAGVFGVKGNAGGVTAMACVPIHNRDALVTGAHRLPPHLPLFDVELRASAGKLYTGPRDVAASDWHRCGGTHSRRVCLQRVQLLASRHQTNLASSRNRILHLQATRAATSSSGTPS